MGEPPVAVAGYRANVTDLDAVLEAVQAVRDARGAPVQLVDARFVYGADHLRQAALLATRARDAGRSAADDPAVEVLRYAAGARQIGKAFERMGLRPGETEAVAAVAMGAGAQEALDDVAARLGWARDDAALEGTDAVLDALGVTKAERDAVPPARWADLVLERVAMVDVLR